nr:4-hydroxy-3-methylbut-2-enyl diphosphate reductase [Raoultella sp. NCTC 9187]
MARRSMFVMKWCITGYVVDSLRKRGAIFIEQISEVPDGAILIFSATASLRRYATRRKAAI